MFCFVVLSALALPADTQSPINRRAERIVPQAVYTESTAFASVIEHSLKAVDTATTMPEIAAVLVESLWTDYHDPQANYVNQFWVMNILSSFADYPDLSDDARTVLGNGLLDYAEEGGVESLAAGRTSLHVLLDALTRTTTPEDPRARAIVQSVAARLFTGTKTDRSANNFQRYANVFGSDPLTLARDTVLRGERTIERLQPYLADFPEPFIDSLRQALIGDAEEALDTLVAVYIEREFADVAEEKSALNKSTGGTENSSGAFAAGTVENSELPSLKTLRMEIRRLLKERGDPERVKRVSDMALRIQGERGRNSAVAAAGRAFLRLLETRRPPLSAEVQTALRSESKKILTVLPDSGSSQKLKKALANASAD